MVEKKSKGIKYVSIPTSAYQAAVCIGFDCKVPSSALKSVQDGCVLTPVDLSLNDIDIAATAQSIYMKVYEKLTASPSVELSNKISGFEMGSDSSQVYMSLLCSPAISTIKKVVGLILKNIDPSSNFSKYSSLVKSLGVRADRDAFNYCADQILKQMQSEIQVVIAGGSKFDVVHKTKGAIGDAKFQLLINSTANKLVLGEITGNKTKRSGEAFPANQTMISIKASGLSGLVLKKYLDMYTNSDLCYNGLAVLVPESKRTQVNKLVDESKINKYITVKYSKVKGELYAVLIYIAIAHTLLGPRALSNANAITANGLITALKASLNSI